MWTQIVGKTRLALAPMVNHWWQVPLYVSARGLTTSRIPYGTAGFAVELDFIDHQVEILRDDGRTWSMELAPRSVAEFYDRYMSGLRSLDLDVRIWPVPVEVANGIRFADDETHASYDARAAHDFWCALAQASRVLEVFRGRFVGKCSPVHFFWGSFDLACTRFNGARAPQHPALERYSAIGQLLTGRNEASAEDGIGWVRALCVELKVPALRAWGITEADLPSVVEKAATASSMKANPLPLTSEELLAVVKAAR